MRRAAIRPILILLTLTLLAPTRAQPLPQQQSATYTNPLPVDVADPFVIRQRDTYYLYGTSESGTDFRVYTSRDLVNWTDRGIAFGRREGSWGRQSFWAPCVIGRHGEYFLYYSAIGKVPGDKTSHRICVAKSDSPLGPFVDVAAPLLDIGKAVIDAHVFIDEDDKAYLYYSLDCSENTISELYVVRLGEDLVTIEGDPVFCTRPSQEWEGKQWNEAPFVFKHSGKYIMMYSGQGFFDPNYSAGYATADSPLGPWTKASENPILKKTPQVSGPGHNCVIPSPDGSELFVIYHAHKKLTGGHERQLCLDRLSITKADNGTVTLKITGPTRDPQPMPKSAMRAAQVP